MSQTLTDTILHEDAAARAAPRAHAARRWIKRAIVLLVVLWIASEAISLALQHTGLRNVLTARLQAAFGRPVDVGSYNFSLLDGLALEANSVTVREDPRFGQEYFLHADSVAVRLRWTSLLLGRVEFGTLSLNHPSLNLVRNSAGEWNLTQWLPQPGASAGSPAPYGPAFPSSAIRFRRVVVDAGRINFKNGDDKLPFAFIGVRGTAETDRPGRWRLSLDATPWRAAIAMQQAGTIHLSGDLGGTSSRLRPASLDVNWSDASLSDVLRLVTGDDDGIRGALDLALNAHTVEQNGAWDIQSHAALQQLHRSDLAPRADTPSLSITARSKWDPVDSALELRDLALETAHSNAHATGRFLWNRVGASRAGKSVADSSPLDLTLTSQVNLADLLPWLRAFHGGVSETVASVGSAQIRATAAGWPPRISSASVVSPGADFVSANFRHPAHLGPLNARYDSGSVSFQPVALSFGPPDNALHFDSPAIAAKTPASALHLAANVVDVHDVLVVAASLGWNLAHGWDVSGPARADLRWQGSPYPWRNPPVGSINWGAGPGSDVLRVPFLNLPVTGINAVSEWKPGSRHLALASAEAFGAHWSGVFDRRSDAIETENDLAGGWQFTLGADHLAAADLDRWLNPAWRQSFLARVLPFLNSRSAGAAVAAPDSLRAAGRLTIDQFLLTSLAVRKLQGDVKIDGRHLAFSNATGQFYGGDVSGKLEAELLAAPVYHATLDFSHVDAAALVAATPALAGLTARSAGGQISLTAAGSNRADLTSSLVCEGTAIALAPKLLNVDFSNRQGSSFDAVKLAQFASAQATFSCANRKINFQSLTLPLASGEAAAATGTVDFGRNLDLMLQAGRASGAAETAPAAAFHLTGTLADPQIAPVPASVHRSR
jgi:hypothetical protein